MRDKMRVAVLLSREGTTLQAIIRATKSGRLPAEVVLVISNRPDAGGLVRAEEEGILERDRLVISPKGFENSEAFGEVILGACRERGVDFIGQYGWMVRTPPNVIEAFPRMMVNQHPGPLDPGYADFGGKGMFGRRVHSARLHFVRTVQHEFWTEAIAQRVAIGYDEGALLGVKRIAIAEDDDSLSLQARLLPEQHELQVETLERFTDGSVKEFRREQRLIGAGEEPILLEAKEVGRKQFPKG